MKPTMNLRFVEREIHIPLAGYENVVETKKIKVLQQLWQNEFYGMNDRINYVQEWRDVPLEKE